MTKTIVTQETPIIPTAELSESAIIWCRGGSAALLEHLVLRAPYRCPQCGDPAGHLYRDEDTPEGACLSCKIDAEAIAEYERTEEDTFHNAAEAAYGCLCGID